MEDAVDEGRDAVDQRNLGALLQMAALRLLHAQVAAAQLVGFLLQHVVQLVVILLAPVLAVEEPQQEHQHQNGCQDGYEHPVELHRRLVVLGGTRFQLAVLARLFLHVQIEVAVVVAGGLVVQGGIDHAELFADAGNEVGSLVDGGVCQCLLQVFQRHHVVAHGMVARCQRAVSTGYLVDVAIVAEDVERLCCQQRVAGMFGQRLLGLCLEIGIVEPLGDGQTAAQEVHLLVVDVFRRALGDDAACTDVVEVVQVLCRVAAYLVGVDGLEGLDGLAFQAYIIIIGGVDNGKLRFSIAQALLLTGCQLVALLVDAEHAVQGMFTEVVEFLVARTALAQAHLLHIAYEEFQLIVGECRNSTKQGVSPMVFHACNGSKGQVVQSFGRTLGCRSIILDGIKIAIVIGV